MSEGPAGMLTTRREGAERILPQPPFQHQPIVRQASSFLEDAHQSFSHTHKSFWAGLLS